MHPKYTIRKAAAAHENISAETLQTLLGDSSASVANTTKVMLLVADVTIGQPKDIPHSEELSRILGCAIKQNDIGTEALERLLDTLFKNPAWVADKDLLKTAWKYDIHVFGALARAAGLSSALTAAIGVATGREKWIAVDMAAYTAKTGQELYQALNDNERELTATLKSAKMVVTKDTVKPGQAKRTIAQLERRNESVQCAYLAMNACPDDVLQEAALGNSGLAELAEQVTVANGAHRPAFKEWAFSEIVRVWEHEGYVP